MGQSMVFSTIVAIIFKFSLFSVDFSVQVLSSSSWPFQQGSAFNLPVEVSINIC